MDSKKICFIICVNNDMFFKEALYYINKLNIPDGYTIDCITIYDATSMASGYNEGMLASDAKYKIYMHQDVLIINPDFLFYMLDIFKDNTLGMLGITGPEKMPSNGIMWEEKSNGSFYTTCIYTTRRKISPPTKQNYQEVEAIDGMLMATQYDIPWRSDLFDGWDFYDASQSFEYRRHGYKIAIILCSNALVIHNDGLLNLKDYNKYRHIFIDKYIKK